MRRIGAEGRSLRTAVVMEKAGKYWRDVAKIDIEKDGTVHVRDSSDPQYLPTESEAQRIKDECASFTWPEVKKTMKLSNLPDELKNADPISLFEFRDVDKSILMLQQRIDNAKEGTKRYIPWTYFDDNIWRKMEPDGKLPLWGLDQLNDNSIIFIHEGAKAARAIREMVEGKTPEARAALKAHPWGEELSNAAHLGWIGGALSPARTDWSPLKRQGAKRAYIVSDNDAPGVAAVAPISMQLRLPTYHVQFTNDWPVGFDLADEFPPRMFKKLANVRYYVGPAFRACVNPATWATDSIPNPRGKNTILLRDHFKEMWAYIEEVDLFVCIEMPDIIRPDKILNNMLAGFSHVNNTTSLMVRAYRGRITKLCYRPDIKGRVVTDRTTTAINLHSPTLVKSVTGDISPFLEFMHYLFPVEGERDEVMKWVATLVARPERRMLYALLLISEKQGMGKTTLGEKVLAPLVGENNVSFPNEEQIVTSQFNGWLANKRLVIVGEIYSGHSWKAYNRLKGFITDRMVDVNEKFERPYKIENWSHFFVSSNSRRALKMEDDDRRWFYPTVTEVAWPPKKFAEFILWLQSGGLGIVRHWADAYGNYVEDGARAPMTGLKQELIEASRSEAQREVADLARAAMEENRPIAFAMKDIEGWVRSAAEGRVFDTDHELRKTMTDIGMITAPKRIKVNGRLQYVLMTPPLHEALRNLDEATNNQKLREAIVQPNTIMGASM